MQPGAVILALPFLLGSAISQDEPPPVLPPSQNKPPAWLVDNPGRRPGRPVFRVGGGVAAPRAIFSPNPRYSEKARNAHQQGTVVLWLIVENDGLPSNVKVARSLNPDLNQLAIDAVKKWKFAPATKEGKPVAVMINVEVTFRLY